MTIVDRIEIMRRTRLEGTIEIPGSAIEYLGRDWRFGGRYRVTVGAMPGVSIKPYIDALAITDPSTTDITQAITNAEADIAANYPGAALLFPAVSVVFPNATGNTYLIGTNHTQSEKWELAAGAVLHLADGITLTAEKWDNATCPDRGQHFSWTGTGVVSIPATSGCDVLFPEWWGAVPDNSTDCTDAFNAMFAAPGQGTSQRLAYSLAVGTYKCNGPIMIVWQYGFTIRGEAPYGSIIKSHATGEAAFSILGCRFYRLENFCVRGDSTNTPYCALLLSRVTISATPRQCDFYLWNNVYADGVFDQAVWILANAEVGIYQPVFAQFLEAPRIFWFVTDPTVVSGFDAITPSGAPPVYTGDPGATSHHIMGGELTFKSTYDDGNVIDLEGVLGCNYIDMQGTYCYTSTTGVGGNIVRVQDDTRVVFLSLKNIHIEGDKEASVLKVGSGCVITGLILSNIGGGRYRPVDCAPVSDIQSARIEHINVIDGDTEQLVFGDISNAVIRDWWSPSGARQITVGGNVLQDNDCEAVGTADWTPVNNATLAKDAVIFHGGTQSLKITYNGTANPAARQSVLESGVQFRIVGWVRDDGTAPVRVIENGVVLWTSATTASWQQIGGSADGVVFTATGTDLDFECNTAGAGDSWIDDLNLYRGRAINVDAELSVDSDVVEMTAPGFNVVRRFASHPTYGSAMGLQRLFVSSNGPSEYPDNPLRHLVHTSVDWDPGTVPAGGTASTTIAVSVLGVLSKYAAFASFADGSGLPAGVLVHAQVLSSQVRVDIVNTTGAGYTPGSKKVNVVLMRFLA